MAKLEVILKLSEVCNIACTYCYYFLNDDRRFEHRPAYLSDDMAAGLSRFVNESLAAGLIDSVQVDLHGGEALMIGVRRFRDLCGLLRRQVAAPMRLCLTTNAMLVDDAWIDAFAEFDVAVCVSLDGPEAIHDRRRIDKRQAGTHARVTRGLRALMAAHRDGRIAKPSVLCVIDPSSDPREVYDYIVGVEGIDTLDFLMPDHTHDSIDGSAESVRSYIGALMEHWLAGDDPRIRVRTLNSVLSLLVSGPSYLAGFGADPALVMTVGSDGEIDTDDFLKPCGIETFGTRANILTAGFADVFDSPAARHTAAQLRALPEGCSECAFAGVCRGGQATHRFSRARGFDNISVYCGAQFELFRLGARHLLGSGVPAETIARACAGGDRERILAEA